jgi:hypothetical protein
MKFLNNDLIFLKSLHFVKRFEVRKKIISYLNFNLLLIKKKLFLIHFLFVQDEMKSLTQE